MGKRVNHVEWKLTPDMPLHHSNISFLDLMRNEPHVNNGCGQLSIKNSVSILSNGLEKVEERMKDRWRDAQQAQ